MIKSIQLKMFQAHKNSLLEFCPGINAICGQSDQGKSSIIRAFKWISENRPLGDSFRSHFNLGKDTEAIITVDEGSVARVKGDKNNYYKLSSKEKPEKANGTKVPDEVTELLNIRSVNTQYQMDPPFMVSLGSSKLSQYLNEEVRLDVIDRATSNIRKKINKNNSQLENIEANQESIKKQLESFQNLEDIEGRVFVAEGLTKQINEKKNTNSSLLRSIQNIEKNTEKIQALKKILDPIHIKMEQAQKQYSNLDQMRKEEKALSLLLLEIKENTEQVKYSKKAKTILSPLSDEIPKKYQQLKESKEKAENLYVLLTKITRQKKTIIELKQQVESACGKYKEAIPETCPTCGQEWPEDADLPMSM